jgi:hypothetical protein
MMDFMMINFFLWWMFYWKSFRIIVTYLLFFGIRGIIQVRILAAITLFHRTTSS